MDPLDDSDDTVLREHFAALRTETLSRARPAGALAARRAYANRHRRRLLVTAAAATVLVVLGATGGYLLEDRPATHQDVTAAHTSTATPADRVGQGAGPTRGPTAAESVPVVTPPAPSSPAGGPVPPGFRVESITFISPNVSWVLGYAPCLSERPWSECPAVLHSRDGGRTWVGGPAPGDAAFTGDIRFANSHDGWIVARAPLLAEDPGGVSGVLYATHDGGTTWHTVTSVPAAATVEAASGRVWVATGPHSGDSHTLWSAATGSDSFSKVAEPAGTGLVLHGDHVYAYGEGNDLLAVDDGTVSRRSLPCAEGYQAGSVLAAADDLSLAVVCAGPPDGSQSAKQGFTSTDGGVTWTPMAGAPDPAGSVTSLASTRDAVFLAGQEMPVRVSRDGGQTWSVALKPDGPDGFSYVGFTDADHGIALTYQSSTVIYLTSDAGRTWKPHRFD
ncbi:hypothetical protein [Rugosimonospora africana]|uniref:BNR/Asp-box repeat-containing protein n=1 Tax=Rugosimonospora africana TaxID=556532 RepID=A0A8J3QPC6_9ACTN|nr:hypothetical protein [Rugosimonospora africana]GIH14583.1 hypothetical protein Raf01_27550 [Rugosimonospora africana]